MDDHKRPFPLHKAMQRNRDEEEKDASIDNRAGDMEGRDVSFEARETRHKRRDCVEDICDARVPLQK